MIPLTTLHDKYIDRSKLFEQKNPFDSSSPTIVGRNKYNDITAARLTH